MTRPFDPKSAIKVSKARENMIAYVAFAIREKASGSEKEGFLKIASRLNPDGGGFLALTFLVDTVDEALKKSLHAMFDRLSAEVLKAAMGDNFETVSINVLDQVGDIRDWVVEEISIHLRRLEGYEKTVVEKDLIPTMEKIWPVGFHTVEWLPVEEKNQLTQSLSKRYPRKDQGALRRVLNKLLGDG